MEAAFRAISVSPLVSFTILLLVVLTIPPIFERLRLPGLVGLLVAGVVLGQDGLRVLSSETETMHLLSDIGKVYLMFVAGLEIDLVEFRRKKERSLSFGIATFALPLLTGMMVAKASGLGWNASVLVGSLLASHTLLGYPIVQRLGLVKNEAVTVAVGATIFTDISALLVLAICVSIHAGEFSLLNLVIQLGSLAIYAVIVLFGFDWAGKEYFRRTGDEEGNQFLFILLAVFVAAVGAQVIHVDTIVGAFLAGLAINDVVGDGPVKEKVEFVGSVMFIPFFFVGMGLLLDVPAFVDTITTELSLTLAIVGGLFASKFLAAIATKWLYGYGWNESLIIWSLSLPQVAATLAAALAGKQVGLIPPSLFNSIIVLMLATSLLGPLLTERFASQIPAPNADFANLKSDIWWESQNSSFTLSSADSQSPFRLADAPFTIVVPISNPYSFQYLLQLSALLANHEQGKIVPLSIAKANVHMDEPDLDFSLVHSQTILQRAMDFTDRLNVKTASTIRIDDDIANGISRAAREANASLILMGWREKLGLRARLFGNVINKVFWSSHCPVAVTRLLEDPNKICKILVPVKSITPQAIRTVQFAMLFAETKQAKVTVLHVTRRKSEEAIAEFKTNLTHILSNSAFKVAVDILIDESDNVADVILKTTRHFDLVVLRSMRRRTAGGLAVSDVTTEVIHQLPCSMILFGEPHS